MADGAVASEEGFLSEAESAQEALKGPLASVGEHVVLEVAVHTGRVGTQLALETLLSIMRATVDSEGVVQEWCRSGARRCVSEKW